MTMHRLISAVALASAASVAEAQLPNASTAAFGMAGNYTALAQGYDAVAWNPANLALPHGPTFSLSLLSLGGLSGIDPVRLNDVTRFGGTTIDNATKEQWLKSIGTGTERGRVEGGLSVVALNVGWVGFQVGASGTGDANINQDAAEAILFGNAGRTGSPRDFHFNGSRANGSTFVTGAVSFAVPIPVHFTGSQDERFALGVTGKYVVGAVVGRAQDGGSLVTADSITVKFPAIYSPDVSNHGAGTGIDVGALWSSTSTTIGVTARNVTNSFAWATETLRTRSGAVSFDGTNSETNFDEMPYSSAPASMRAALEAEKFTPEFAFGIARRLSSLTVTVDASTRASGGIAVGPQTHVGMGAEFTGIPLLPLRAGFAAVSGGVQGAVGAGVRLGHYEVGGGFSVRSRDGGSETGVMVSLVSIR